MTLSTKQTLFYFRKVDVIWFLMKVDSTSAKELFKIILGDLSLYWEKSAYPWFQKQDHSRCSY